MGPHGRDDGRKDLRLRLQDGAETGRNAPERQDSDLVFDFTGLESPDLRDLSLILTARLQAGPEDRVWVRALPVPTWRILRALGMDHLFEPFPGADSEPN